MGNQFAFFVCICSTAINGEPAPQEGGIQFRWKCLPLQNTICSQTRFVLFCKIGFVLRMCCSQELAKVFWCVFPAAGGIGTTFKITLTLCHTRKRQAFNISLCKHRWENKVVARKETISGDSLTPIEEVGDHGWAARDNARWGKSARALIYRPLPVTPPQFRTQSIRPDRKIYFFSRSVSGPRSYSYYSYSLTTAL